MRTLSMKLRAALAALLLIAFLGVTAPTANALLIRNYSAAKHTRSLTNSSFIGVAYDWSGLALGRGAALVSPNYYVTANHFKPASTTLTFRDSNGNDFVRTIDDDADAGGRVAGTDIWVGKLTSPVPSSIHPFPILHLSSPADYVGLEFFVAGSHNGVGRNSIWRVGTREGAAGTVIEYLYDNPGVGDDEAMAGGSESGLPSLTVVNGGLALLGTHYYQLLDDDSNPAGNGDTFLRGYIDELNTIMGTDNVTLAFIPEPTTLGLFGAGLLSVFIIRRRRRAA